MPLSKRGRRKAKKAKAIELVLTDHSITRIYEEKLERVLEQVHEEPLISYSWSVKKVTNDKEEAKEDWQKDMKHIMLSQNLYSILILPGNHTT